MKLFKHIALGGTFDLFHAGHKKFLLSAFKLSEIVSIGVSSDEFAKSLGKVTITTFDQRKRDLVNFLKLKDLLGRAKFLKLKDMYGSTLEDKSIDGIIVTNDSAAGAELINETRLKKNMSALPILKTSLVIGSDKRVISTSRIKNGEIDELGFTYLDYLLSKELFILPENLRRGLSLPFGKKFVSTTSDKPSMDVNAANIFAVGDQTTVYFMQNNLIPKISIIDFKIERKVKFKEVSDLGFGKGTNILNVSNPPGRITRELILSIQTALHAHDNLIIVVDGEEDLAVIPLVLLSPTPSSIFYGIRKFGIVQVDTTIQKKKEILNLLKKFN